MNLSLPPPLGPLKIVRWIKIWAPAPLVWSLVHDDRSIPLWMPQIKETRYLGGKPAGNPVGSRFVQRIEEGGRLSEYEGEVIAYEPGRMVATRLRPKALSIDVRYIVTGDEDYTTVDYICDVSGTTLGGRFMLLFGGGVLAKIAETQLSALKLVAEKRKPAV